jgi:hypothetical protein
MPLPPPPRVLLPTFEPDDVSDTVTIRVADFRRLVAFALEGVAVDEDWYLAQYPDVGGDAKARRSPGYAIEHYRNHGYLEGRLPYEPEVDEEWYRRTNPDVDAAIRKGTIPNAKFHFIDSGYQEGRKPAPDTGGAASSPGTARPAARALLRGVGGRS